MKQNFTPVRGTNDFLPADAELREQVREIIIKNYQKNGFCLVNTPILENLDFLQSSDGGENLKLMFKTIKRGGELDLKKENLTEADITSEGLRYDLTVPLVRMFCGHKEELPLPFKSIQMDYAFRAERPQRGRERQFVQCDIDIIGDNSTNAEIDVLSTGLETLSKLGFDDVTLKINDRRILNELIKFCGFEEEQTTSVCIALDKIDKIGFDGVLEELTQKGFEKEKAQKLVLAVEKIKESGIAALKDFGVSEENIARITNLIEILQSAVQNAKVEFEISIVRGQGYYTGTIYEVYCAGMRGAIAAGGRFDKMVGKLTGQDLPAVGFSIGFEPIVVLLKESQKKLQEKNKLVLLFADGDDIKDVLAQKQELKQNYCVSTYKMPKNLKNLLEKLKNCGFTHFKMANCPEIKKLSD